MRKKGKPEVHWGTGYQCPATRPGDRETTNKKEVTCRHCIRYVSQTGDGPESLKNLLRF